MSDGARLILVQGIAAAKANQKDEARFYLEWVLRADASVEQQVEAWRWLVEISDDPAEQRDYLHRVLAYAPADPGALRKLAILDGRLKPDEIVDPDRLPRPEAEVPQPAGARRFACPHCGGQMHFTPDRQALTCTFCGHRQRPAEGPGSDEQVEEQDFIVTLAKAAGHLRPVATRSFRCPACGAAFVLAPESLSLTCAYCDSAYVVELSETRELIPPEGVVPFAVSRLDAARRLHEWLDTRGLGRRVQATAPVGFYFPVWTFDVSGTIGWRGFKYEPGRGLEPLSGTLAIFHDDLLVPASDRLPAPLAAEIGSFDLRGLVPYDSGYLADWPAEIYTVSMADASLRAREQALDLERRRIAIPEVSDLTLSSAGMSVVSFKLILVPLWFARYSDGERQYHLAVNGQTGSIRGEKPRGGIRTWLATLLGDD